MRSLSLLGLALVLVARPYEPQLRTERQQATAAQQRGKPAPAQQRAAEELRCEDVQARYERWIAGGTVALAIITAALATYTALLWGATRRLAIDTTRTANRQFLGAFPPRLHVRHLELREGEWPDIEYTVSNDGQSKATLIDGRIVLLVVPGGQAIPDHPLKNGGELLVQQTEIPAGERLTLTWHDDGRTDPRGGTNDRAVIVGYINYLDENQVVRRTGFARVYGDSNHRFRPFGDPEYEYPD